MSELDPKLAEMLRRRREEDVPPLNTLSVAAARRRHREHGPSREGPEVAEASDISVPGPGGELSLRIYRPDGRGPFPVLVWMHGGGFVLGDLETSDAVCRTLANEVPCLVVSVDYRLAPEHPFPAAPKDCYAALQWTEAHVEAFGGDPTALAVGGDSAGGNLAAVTALRSRDGDGPELAHQLLVYPITTNDRTLPSHRENADGYGLTTDEIRWFDDHYVDDEFDRVHPYAYPLRARDLSGLPPATVLTAQFDPLRDDGVRYADRLDEAGVAVTRRHYDDAIHGFLSMVAEPDVDIAQEAATDAATALRDAFDG